jgi:hypothetical protein
MALVDRSTDVATLKLTDPRALQIPRGVLHVLESPNAAIVGSVQRAPWEPQRPESVGRLQPLTAKKTANGMDTGGQGRIVKESDGAQSNFSGCPWTTVDHRPAVFKTVGGLRKP